MESKYAIDQWLKDAAEEPDAGDSDGGRESDLFDRPVEPIPFQHMADEGEDLRRNYKR